MIPQSEISYLSGHFDLVTPDGYIASFSHKEKRRATALIVIENISPHFVGFSIPIERVQFNIKSTLAQLGLNGMLKNIELSEGRGKAELQVDFEAFGLIAEEMLSLLMEGSYIGKLFAADDRRIVRDPDYLDRMFGRSDNKGLPLLSLGGMQGSNDLILDKIEGRCVAYLSLLPGKVVYQPTILGLLPTIAKSLIAKKKIRGLLELHQELNPNLSRNVEENEILLVKTQPLHIRTVFGRVVNSLLSPGYTHTTASLLQPDTQASGDIYELYGNSKREITDIPLEFYTLEPYREHVFFSDRDQLQNFITEEKAIFEAFETAPLPLENKTSVFIVKGEQLKNLSEKEWIVRDPRLHEFPGPSQSTRQALMVERYVEQQPGYPFLKAIEEGVITSQGILLTRYFPSPLMKRMLLSDHVQRMLKGIYFRYPSKSYGEYFSSEDRSLLHDLANFGIPVFWVDDKTGKILQFVQKPDRDYGMFVPNKLKETFLHATAFGIYGSNLKVDNFEEQLKILLQGVLDMKNSMSHPLLNPKIPLALVTGGGPGAMELGNKVAIELGILSCANIVDFRTKAESVVNEQQQNKYIQAKMTYRLDKLVERQAEFNLDFPIFLKGGIGTDFEYCLEEVRRKVGAVSPNPILLFGDVAYWKDKITTRFQSNLANGTIKGSEWISNCFYAVQSAEQGLEIYRKFFEGTLPIGKGGPIYQEGFVTGNSDVL